MAHFSSLTVACRSLRASSIFSHKIRAMQNSSAKIFQCRIDLTDVGVFFQFFYYFLPAVDGHAASLQLV